MSVSLTLQKEQNNTYTFSSSKAESQSLKLVCNLKPLVKNRRFLATTFFVCLLGAFISLQIDYGFFTALFLMIAFPISLKGLMWSASEIGKFVLFDD